MTSWTTLLVRDILRRICEYQRGIYEDVVPFRRFLSNGATVHGTSKQAQAFESILFRWLALYPSTSRLLDSYEPIKHALACHCAYTGRVKILQYLHERYILQSVAANLCQMAIAGQRLDVLEYLVCIGYELRGQFEPVHLSWKDQAVFDFVFEHYRPLCTANTTIYAFASSGLQEHLMRLLLYVDEAQIRLMWSVAASHGHVELARTIYTASVDISDHVFQFAGSSFFSTTFQHIKNAANVGSIDGMFWIYDIANPFFSQEDRIAVVGFCLKYAVMENLWDRVWTLLEQADGRVDYSQLLACLPYFKWPQDESNARRFFEQYQHILTWGHGMLSSTPALIPMFCTPWLPTIKDQAKRRLLEKELMSMAVLYHDGDRLEAREWLGDVDEYYFNAMEWLMDEYCIDKSIAHDVFQGPLGIAAMKRAIENDHIATMRLLLKYGVQIVPEYIFLNGSIRAIKFYLDKVNPEFTIPVDLLVEMASKPTNDAVFQFVHRAWRARNSIDIVHTVESQCIAQAATNGQVNIIIYLAKSFQCVHSPSEYENFLIQHVQDFHRAFNRARHGVNQLFAIWNPGLDACFNVEFIAESLDPLLALTEENLKRLVDFSFVHIPTELIVQCALINSVLAWRAFCILLDAKRNDKSSRMELQRECLVKSTKDDDFETF
ncbi:hypothetical protein AeMF1_004622 [Aphanomyces euteiches]|nr:hypothetical protein AeMF1_004622 [Aphanomyces euteiches]